MQLTIRQLFQYGDTFLINNTLVDLEIEKQSTNDFYLFNQWDKETAVFRSDQKIWFCDPDSKVTMVSNGIYSIKLTEGDHYDVGEEYTVNLKVFVNVLLTPEYLTRLTLGVAL